MPPVKSLQEISAKWIRVSSTAEPEYSSGVANPRQDWAAETARAEGAYEQGVTKAIQSKAFGKGVAAAGTAKWQKNTLEKGPARWSQGIGLSADAFERGFAPFREVIERTNLPARGPKGDPKNIQRVALLAKALHDKKLEMRGR